jgi:aryl-alcohol dehydrogenase-like predicted oxidoreductase
MNFGGRQGEDKSVRIIHSTLDAGINFLDTANVYGHDPLNFPLRAGRSEQIVGKSLQEGKRNRVILATKVHYPMSDDPAPAGSRYEAFRRGFYREDFSGEEVFDVQELVLALAREKGCSGYVFALAWSLSRPGVTSAIIGTRTIEQLDDSLTSLSVTLTEEDYVWLDAITPAGSMTVSFLQYKHAHIFSW